MGKAFLFLVGLGLSLAAGLWLSTPHGTGKSHHANLLAIPGGDLIAFFVGAIIVFALYYVFVYAKITEKKL